MQISIYIPRQVLEEVRQLDEAAVKNLGIKIIDPELSQVMEAMEENSSLSQQDNLCFILARDNSWICATNEKSLSNKCKRENVAVIRGLKIMLELTKANVLSKGDAIDIADMIKTANKRITDEVINTFKNMLDKI